jgi:hypothetical protein
LRSVLRVQKGSQFSRIQSAHDATFHVPSAGIVRFVFSDPRASGYIYALSVVPRCGSMERVQLGTGLLLPAGQHVLNLYDPNLVARVSIAFEPL